MDFKKHVNRWKASKVLLQKYASTVGVYLERSYSELLSYLYTITKHWTQSYALTRINGSLASYFDKEPHTFRNIIVELDNTDRGSIPCQQVGTQMETKLQHWKMGHARKKIMASDYSSNLSRKGYWMNAISSFDIEMGKNAKQKTFVPLISCPRACCFYGILRFKIKSSSRKIPEKSCT